MIERKVEMGRVREEEEKRREEKRRGEERRGEERRGEERRGNKIQVCEKVGKSRTAVFSQ